MTLSEHLSATGQNASTFAATLGVPVSTVTRWLNGKRRPGLDMLQRLYAATNGKVTAESFHRVSADASSEAGPASAPELEGASS